ncbi:unnamed protein product [Pedinophyceae sp. YPF-701]|nr:unnamed protein product [Pedinophyceae sp. YPF-701]
MGHRGPKKAPKATDKEWRPSTSFVRRHGSVLAASSIITRTGRRETRSREADSVCGAPRAAPSHGVAAVEEAGAVRRAGRPRERAEVLSSKKGVVGWVTRELRPAEEIGLDEAQWVHQGAPGPRRRPGRAPIPRAVEPCPQLRRAKHLPDSTYGLECAGRAALLGHGSVALERLPVGASPRQTALRKAGEHAVALIAAGLKRGTLTLREQLEAQLIADLAEDFPDGDVRIDNVGPTAALQWLVGHEMPAIAPRAHTRVPGEVDAVTCALATLRNSIANFRAVFEAVLRTGPYDHATGVGNPLISPEVGRFEKGFAHWLHVRDVDAQPAVPLTRAKATVLLRSLELRKLQAEPGTARWFRAVEDFCAWALLFLTWLRGEEAVELNWGDVRFEPLPGLLPVFGVGILEVQIRHSKHAAQTGDNVPQRVVVPTMDYPEFQFEGRMPVVFGGRTYVGGLFNLPSALASYRCALRTAGLDYGDSSPIFRTTDRRSHLPSNERLTVGALLERFKTGLESVWFDDSGVEHDVRAGETLHSCRRGGLQDAIGHGMRFEAAQVRGRWATTDTMLLYLIDGHRH